jgi:hypothetical protein
MRTAILVIALSIVAFGLGHDAMPRVTTASPAAPARVDFDHDVKPILQSKCMPCHFSGGKMYDHLPFDRPETVRKLGEKLFTRIHDEKHRRVIREFLTQAP